MKRLQLTLHANSISGALYNKSSKLRKRRRERERSVSMPCLLTKIEKSSNLGEYQQLQLDTGGLFNARFSHCIMQ